jgi:hypothetical protein
VNIEPMDAYGPYLAAAIAKKQVPLSVLADKGKAEYIPFPAGPEDVPKKKEPAG